MNDLESRIRELKDALDQINDWVGLFDRWPITAQENIKDILHTYYESQKS